MKEELEKNLVKEFPHVFYVADPSGAPYDMFGIETNDGWYDIIYKAASKLEPIFAKQIEKDPAGYKFGYYRTSQLKEKFGTMRWYISGGTKNMYSIISKAEKKSAKTCEQCGKKGKLRGKSWYYTACNLCCKPEDRDNLEYLEQKYEEQEKKK